MLVAIAIKKHSANIFFKRIREDKSKGDTCYNMFNVLETTAPLLLNVKIDNKLNIYNYTTRETYGTVCSVTGIQKVHSIITVPVTVHSKTYRLDIQLLDTLCLNLYGRNWIQATNVSIDHIMREIKQIDNC